MRLDVPMIEPLRTPYPRLDSPPKPDACYWLGYSYILTPFGAAAGLGLALLFFPLMANLRLDFPGTDVALTGGFAFTSLSASTITYLNYSYVTYCLQPMVVLASEGVPLLPVGVCSLLCHQVVATWVLQNRLRLMFSVQVALFWGVGMGGLRYLIGFEEVWLVGSRRSCWSGKRLAGQLEGKDSSIVLEDCFSSFIQTSDHP